LKTFRALALLALPVLVGAASTTTWELSTWQDFLKGKFRDVALSRDGRLSAAPALTLLFDSGQPAVWCAAAGPGERVYLGTGYRGRLYEVDAASGKGTLLWTAPEPQIFAVTVDSKGVVYAGTSPNGKIYRVENGKASVYFDPKARYIWALRFGPDGALYAGTGDEGRIFRIPSEGTGESYYDTGQSHVTALEFDAAKRLIAGTEPNGLLLRVTAKDKAFVLYDAALPEIRSIGLDADGSLFVAALGGGLVRRTAAPVSSLQSGSGTPIPAAGISITVTDEAQAGLDLKKKEEAAKQAAGTAASAAAGAVPVMEYAGVEKSAIYRVAPDNTVETVWSSKEENIFDLAVSGEGVTFATDANGRIYHLDRERKLSLMAQTSEGEVARILPREGALLAVTSNLGRLYKLGGVALAARYESPVHDAANPARWGRLSLTGSGVKVYSRSGNSSRPDRTWSEWAATGAEGAIVSPNARYIQWRAEFPKGASLDSARLAYLPQNMQPVVKSISVVGQSVAVATSGVKASSAAAVSSSAVYSITVTDTGEASTPALGTPTQTVGRTMARQLILTWQAEDPDADPLTYSVSYRGEGESKWKLLRGGMSETALTVDAEIFADGRYLFRVTASDKSANAAESAREGELVAAPVLIDNTPPVIGEFRRNGARIEIAAGDETSEIKRCEYSLDGGAWTLIEAADGVTDSRQEAFFLTLPATLSAGEHVLVVRVADVSGNVALKKLLL
jgi:hypothetical protein